MKKTLIFSLLIFGLGFLTLACNRTLPVSTPMLGANPTPATGLVPGCGVSLVGAWASQLPTPTPGGTPVPTPAITPYPTPVTYPINGVIRTLVDWQAAYPSATPPVDFTQQMVVPVTLRSGCSGSEYIDNVCWDSGQVTVSVVEEIPPPWLPQCNMASQFFPELVIVPQCNLSVVRETVG